MSPTINLEVPAADTEIQAGLHATNYADLQALLNGGLDDANVNTISASKITGLSTAPAGSITSYIGTSAPSGWLLLDGSTVTNGQTLHPNLWAVLPAAFKSGSNIILPDMRGRMPVGLGTHADVDAIGDSDGLAVGSRRPKHKHTVAGNVTFPYTASGNTGGSGANIESSDLAATGTHVATNGTVVGPQTGSEPTDSPGYFTVNFIIKT